jgi:hypothetical protein
LCPGAGFVVFGLGASAEIPIRRIRRCTRLRLIEYSSARSKTISRREPKNGRAVNSSSIRRISIRSLSLAGRGGRSTALSARRQQYVGAPVSSRPLMKVQPFLRQSLPSRAFYQAGRPRVKEERRLVWRVHRHWREITCGGRFPRRDEIEFWIQREDGANCLLIAAESPIELSHFVVVGVNLAIALSPSDTLAGLLLSQVPRVVSARHGLMIDGGATLRGGGIIYRAVLLPLSQNGATIDHVLGAASYRSLRNNEARSTQVNFRRLPTPRIAGNCPR